MRQNNRKFKPNPSSTSRNNIRSSSIKDIIGDRRFNHANIHRTEGIKRAKRMKVGDAEADDLPSLGQNASSIQCEGTDDARRCYGDFAAKTSEYAFFKKMKDSTCNNANEHPKNHANKLNNVQRSDIFTSKENSNLQKESMAYARSSLPVEKELDAVHYSFLSSPCYGLKNHSEKNVGKKGLFSSKREKLHRWVADKALYDVNEISSKGFDLVSVLISRLLPEDHENNHRRDPVWCQDEPTSKNRLPSFSNPKLATVLKSPEHYKTRFMDSHHKEICSYFDDDFPRSTDELINMNPWEWDPPKSRTQFNHCGKEVGFRVSDEQILGYGIFEDLEESDMEFHIHNGNKLLEPPHPPLLLGWEHNDNSNSISNSNSNKFQLSTWEPEIDTSSTSQDYYYMPNTSFISSPPSSPYIAGESYLASSSLPYTPKHLIDFPQRHYTWCTNESLNKKGNHEHDLESFLFLIQAPVHNILRFLNTGLHSFAIGVENEENLLHIPDEFEEDVKTYDSSSYGGFDHTGYPLLLGDSSES